ncbi:F-box domain [Macleaya cordata]|uniref:F-box domain n=1 Tax=Macleaya cordata TaxID=56857 RepID=A0A200QC27_MACCD|nr:F-box domain [Macleaya cordata]
MGKRMKMMNSSGGGPCLLDLLDRDVLCEILTRLPVKSIVCCKILCKSWKELIETKDFVIFHLNRSRTRPSLLIITPEVHHIHFFTGTDVFGERGSVIHRATANWCHPTSRPLNGLMYSIDHLKASVSIFSLSTLHATPWIQPIAKIEGKEEDGVEIRQNQSYGFGFVPRTMHHKVVCVWEKLRFNKLDYSLIGDAEMTCEVLDLGSHEWRRIDEVPPCRLWGHAVYADGSMYWWSDRAKPWDLHPVQDCLVAFDVESEKFRAIPIPNHIISFSARTPHPFFNGPTDMLLAVDGHIALVDRIDESTVKLWICSDCKGKVRATWVEETISLPIPWEKNRQVLSFHSIEGTEKIIITAPPLPSQEKVPGCIFYYDRKSNTSKKVEISGICPPSKYPAICSASSFVESLLLVPLKLELEEEHEHSDSDRFWIDNGRGDCRVRQGIQSNLLPFNISAAQEVGLAAPPPRIGFMERGRALPSSRKVFVAGTGS